MEESTSFVGLSCLGLIGKGAFGNVYLVQNIHNEQFAIKEMRIGDASPKDRRVAQNEVHVLRQLKHDHVIIYVDSLAVKGCLYVITEYCTGGDLSGFLDQLSQPVPEDLLRVWLWQMSCGLEYMHTFEPRPIFHRDLKPSNVFLTDTGDIRLGDMGIARILEAPNAMAESFCGTPAYMSPEALNEKPYNEKTDIWSLGCCLVEMVTLERAYDGSTLQVLRHVVLKRPPPIPMTHSRELQRLLDGMLRLKYEERPSATDILDDDFLWDCEKKQPADFLRHHKLLENLALHRGPPTSGPAALPTHPPGAPSETIDFNQGQSLRDYQEKKQTRVSGRRQDECLTSSGRLDPSGLHVFQRKESKSKKKTLVTTMVKTDTSRTVVPDEGAAASDSGVAGGAGVTVGCASQRDASLSRILLSSFTLSLSSLQSQRFGTQTADAVTQTYAQVLGDASGTDQMELLKTILIAMLGERSWNEACALIMTANSTSELMGGLKSLLGELMNDQLSHIVIYFFLMESVRQSAVPSSPD